LFSRRTALAAGFAAPFFIRSRRSFAADSFVACRDRLAGLFPNSLTAARALGKVCGDGRDAAALLDSLCDGPGGRLHVANAPLGELRKAMEMRIRADFMHGRTRRIDGWMLSETETRLYAIIAA
jgi:hypothetical protein